MYSDANCDVRVHTTTIRRMEIQCKCLFSLNENTKSLFQWLYPTQNINIYFHFHLAVEQAMSTLSPQSHHNHIILAPQRFPHPTDLPQCCCCAFSGGRPSQSSRRRGVPSTLWAAAAPCTPSAASPWSRWRTRRWPPLRSLTSGSKSSRVTSTRLQSLRRVRFNWRCWLCSPGMRTTRSSGAACCGRCVMSLVPPACPCASTLTGCPNCRQPCFLCQSQLQQCHVTRHPLPYPTPKCFLSRRRLI